ncbi:hypothetical protein C9J85_00800 [Haloferax sp. wsp5]|nr:hypothetical protein C9J85_00800 [Haloferax sp. wsp5]
MRCVLAKRKPDDVHSKIPGQCPKCGSVNVNVTKVAPLNHDRGERWATRVECDECPDYVEWMD